MFTASLPNAVSVVLTNEEQEEEETGPFGFAPVRDFTELSVAPVGGQTLSGGLTTTPNLGRASTPATIVRAPDVASGEGVNAPAPDVDAGAALGADGVPVSAPIGQGAGSGLPPSALAGAGAVGVITLAALASHFSGAGGKGGSWGRPKR